VNHSGVQKQVWIEKGVGAGVPKLALFRIEQLKLVWPRVEEQHGIIEKATGLSLRILSEALALEKFRLLKVGLMQDLLTGHVRVTNLQDVAAS
jgi:type I restriction enzyme S subunit